MSHGNDLFVGSSHRYHIIYLWFIATTDAVLTVFGLKMAEGMQKRLQGELEKLKAVQKDYQKCVTARQQLDSQLKENTIVLEELKRLEADATVYKMIGQVLVKQDLEESKQNVEKRIDYISKEIKRHEGTIKDLEKKQEGHREAMAKLQSAFQQQQVKAAAKA